jgi:hypothetical protein
VSGLATEVIERRLCSQHIGDVTLLDAVEHVAEGGRRITLFLDGIVPPEEVIAPDGAVIVDAAEINGCARLTYAFPEGANPWFAIQGHELHIAPAHVETALFVGADAMAAVRNGESAETVLTWLAFHAEHHGLTGAVILDRAPAGSDPDFARDLERGLAERGWRARVVVLSSEVPLGKPGLPPETHPYCVPEAPGKDRMQVPDPDPWRSPLAAGAIYEIVRMRFLGAARAVANLDVHDLAPPGPLTIFDAAVAAETGVVTLMGRHCFPWRIPKDRPVTFADHICVQFDREEVRRRWCVAPARMPGDAVWRMLRVANAPPDDGAAIVFYRFMALRHIAPNVSKLVARTSLVESGPLLDLSIGRFGHEPDRMPEVSADPVGDPRAGRRAIVTTMKNEGPFILEWLAYHRAIGFDDVLVYTNDCTDGTDAMLRLLEKRGLVQHRENPYREMKCKPQHAALKAAEAEDVIRDAAWVVCMDVDEFVNIKVGNGSLGALFDAVPDANMIAMTWRLFGNSDVHGYEDRPVTEQFLRCAPELCRKPHQAWGFKTLFRNAGIFERLGVHRPKGLKPQLWRRINWVNGSGQRLPREMFRNAWRSTASTYGYDLVQLNHYAVRSVESFLVKRDRGRVNHVDRDQGPAYWFRMNNNADSDPSILRNLPGMHAELARLMADPEIAAAHAHSVACHRAKIAELLQQPGFARLQAELTSPRMERLSRLHTHFGANVFRAGPDVVPEDVAARAPGGDWSFTVEAPVETQH